MLTQYLANWLKLLKGDSRAIFMAAAKASEAAGFLKGFGALSSEAAFTIPMAHRGGYVN